MQRKHIVANFTVPEGVDSNDMFQWLVGERYDQLRELLPIHVYHASVRKNQAQVFMVVDANHWSEFFCTRAADVIFGADTARGSTGLEVMTELASFSDDSGSPSGGHGPESHGGSPESERGFSGGERGGRG